MTSAGKVKLFKKNKYLVKMSNNRVSTWVTICFAPLEPAGRVAVQK